MSSIPSNQIIIDGENAILGRMSSIVAKKLLAGDNVVIVNAEKSIILGDPGTTAEKYRKRQEIKTKSNPRRGPFHPRTTIGIVRRTVRGMLPYKKPHGKEAYKRLRVYEGFPEQFKDEKIEVLTDAVKKHINCSFLTVKELINKL